MHAIQLSHETFARLQTHAVPLVDTIETVINRALDALEGANIKISQVRSPNQLDPAAPPSLSFTTVRSVVIGGKQMPPEETFWNAALISVVREAKQKGLTPKQISDLLLVKNAIGPKIDNGYKFVKEAGISVQGQDANGAWKAIYHIARHININVEISFLWQNNPKAAFPGRTVTLSAVVAS